MSQFGTLTINGKAYDLDDIELNDMEVVEELCPRKVRRDGEEYDEPTPFGELNFSSTRVTKALTWIILRREQPELTLEEVGKIKLVAFTDADEEAPDTGPPVEGAAQSNGSAHDDSGSPGSLESLSIPG